MKIKHNHHFELCKDSIEYIVGNYVRPDYPDCVFTVKGSEVTNDVMVFVEIDDIKGRVIFTDKTDPVFKYHYISPNAKIGDVVKIIENAIRQIRAKNQTDILFDL